MSKRTEWYIFHCQEQIWGNVQLKFGRIITAIIAGIIALFVNKNVKKIFLSLKLHFKLFNLLTFHYSLLEHRVFI